MRGHPGAILLAVCVLVSDANSRYTVAIQHLFLPSRSSDCDEYLADACPRTRQRPRPRGCGARNARSDLHAGPRVGRLFDDLETRAARSEIDVRGDAQRPTDGRAWILQRTLRRRKIICEESRGGRSAAWNRDAAVAGNSREGYALYVAEPWNRVDENIGRWVAAIGAGKEDRVISIETQETETELAEAN